MSNLDHFMFFSSLKQSDLVSELKSYLNAQLAKIFTSDSDN